MRISMLMAREPFGDILIQTLQDYWKERTGKVFEIRWYQPSPGNAAIVNDGFHPWHGNQNLNFFATRDTPRDSFENLRNEYSRSLAWWKRPVQRLYVSAATHRYGISLFSSIAIGVRPSLPDAGKCIILGGNNRLRILHPHSRKCVVILKRGFANRFIDNEIVFRSGMPLTFAPRFLDCSSSYRWFEESYVSGIPINRLPRDSRITLSQRACRMLAESVTAITLRKEPAADHVYKLLETIKVSISGSRFVEQKQRVLSSLMLLNDIVHGFFTASERIETSQTHGDFQEANILQDESRLWFIDWEYTDRRSAAYDPLVLGLGSRHPAGLAGRVQQLVEGRNQPLQAQIEHWPGFMWNRNTLAKWLFIFLVEELQFYVIENCNSQYSRFSESGVAFLAELPACLNIVTAKLEEARQQ